MGAPAAKGPTRRIARLVRLAEESAEYAGILGAFSESMDAAALCGIYRVENPALRAVYEACRSRMDKEGRQEGPSTRRAAAAPPSAQDPRGAGTGTKRPGRAAPGRLAAPSRLAARGAVGVPRDVGANEKQLFHATTREACGAIIREGFDAHRAGQAHGAALGPGIYVASEAKFSHRYSSEDSVGVRAMFVCSVLLGDTSGRDSQSDGAARPAQYAVHREQQVLPTHVLHYRA